MGKTQQWLEWVALQEIKHKIDHTLAKQTLRMLSLKEMLGPLCCQYLRPLPRNGPEKGIPFHWSILSGMQT